MLKPVLSVFPTAQLDVFSGRQAPDPYFQTRSFIEHVNIPMENPYDNQQMINMMPPETFNNNFVCPTSTQWSNGYLPSNTDIYGTSLVCNSFFNIYGSVNFIDKITFAVSHWRYALSKYVCFLSSGFKITIRLLQSTQSSRLQQLLSPSVSFLIFLVLQLTDTNGFELQFLSRKLPLPALQPPALLLSVTLVQFAGWHDDHRVRALWLIRLFLFICRRQLFQKGYLKLRDVLLIKMYFEALCATIQCHK